MILNLKKKNAKTGGGAAVRDMEIWNFHCIVSQTCNIVVPHQAQLLFHKNTQFRAILELYPRIPIHWFQFTKFDNLKAHLNVDTYLTGSLSFKR